MDGKCGRVDLIADEWLDRLFKHVGGEKAKVAEYGARNAWDKGGLLVVDSRKDEGVDLLVAVMSCVALGTGTDSFTK